MAYPEQHKRLIGGRQRNAKHVKAALRPVAILFGVLCLLLLVTRLRRSPPPKQAESPLFELPPYGPIYTPPSDVARVAKLPVGSTDVRTEFVTIASAANEAICAQWVSAALSGMRTTTAGWGTSQYHAIEKLSHLTQVIALKGMRDWDVVVYVNETVMFTGIDIQPFVADFVKRSPAHPDDIDVRAIREGTSVAPVRFATEASCASPETLGNTSVCEESYFALEAAVEQYGGRHDFHYLPQINVTRGRSGTPYLSSGFFMARVWALKELAAAQNLFVAKLRHPNAVNHTDQSVFTALYLDLRWGELNLGLLASPYGARAAHKTVNQFGMHYGLLDLWYSRPPLSLIHHSGTPDTRMDASLYGFPFQSPTYPCAIRPSTPEVTIRGILGSIPSPAQYVHDVPVRYSHPKGITTISLAPPLVGHNPRLIDRTEEGTFRASFPGLIDVPIMPYEYCRPEVAQFLGWYLVLDLKAGQRVASAEVANTTLVEVVNAGTRILTQVRLGDECRDWIDSNIVKGPHSY